MVTAAKGPGPHVHKVGAQRAAHAAGRQLHEARRGGAELGAASQHCAIDVHVCHVVHYHRQLQRRLVKTDLSSRISDTGASGMAEHPRDSPTQAKPRASMTAQLDHPHC